MCHVKRARANAHFKNPKATKKVELKSRQKKMKLQNGQIIPISATSHETANVEEDDYDDDGDDFNVNSDVDLHGGDSLDENSHSTGQRTHPVADLFSKPTTSKKTTNKTKQGVRKSSCCSKRRPPQHHAQPAIAPSQVSKTSKTHNYLRAAKGKHEVSVYTRLDLIVFAFFVLQPSYLWQLKEDLGLVHQRISGL